MLDNILEISEVIGRFIAVVIFSIYFCKKYIDKITTKLPIGEKIKKQNEEDLNIVSTMEYYKELLDADRILLFEFHNGDHYSNFRNALRMSASYEVYRAGLEESMSKCTGLPIAIMPHLIAEITSNGFFICKDIEDIKNIMPSTYNFKKSIGLKSFYDTAIKDKNGCIVGFVAVQWNKIMPDIDNEDVKKLVWRLEESIQKITAMDADNKKKKIKFSIRGKRI